MKTKRQARPNCERTPLETQPSNSTAAAETKPDLLIPSQVVKEMEASLADLRRAAGKMVALALISADWIRREASGYSEWEDLVLPGFEQGVQELAGELASAFGAQLDDWTYFLGLMMEPLRSHHDALQPVRDGAVPLPAPDNTGDFEWVVADLVLWGEKLSLLVANRDSRSGGVRVVIESADCLNAAWERAHVAHCRLIKAFCGERATVRAAA